MHRPVCVIKQSSLYRDNYNPLLPVFATYTRSTTIAPYFCIMKVYKMIYNVRRLSSLVFVCCVLVSTSVTKAGLISVTSQSMFFDGLSTVDFDPGTGYNATTPNVNGDHNRSLFTLTLDNFATNVVFDNFALRLFNINDTMSAGTAYQLFWLGTSLTPNPLTTDFFNFVGATAITDQFTSLSPNPDPVSFSFNTTGLNLLTQAAQASSSSVVLIGGVLTGDPGDELFGGNTPAPAFTFETSFSGSPTAVPEPASLAFLGLIGSVAGFRSMRRAKKKFVGA